MSYYIGQGCGLIGTVFNLVLPLLRKKWQMLLAIGLINVFFALNLLLIREIGSGIIMNCVAILQTVVSYWHLKKDIPVTKSENLIFLALYVGLGLLGVRKGLDFLPIIAAIFNMLATFQPDEQKTRFLLLINTGIYCTYYALVGAAAMVAEFLSLIATVVGLIRYRKKR